MTARCIAFLAFCLISSAAAAQNVRQVSTGTDSDSLQPGDVSVPGNTVAWINADPVSKTEELTTNNIVCDTGTYKYKEFTIKDEIGTAGTYAITVQAHSGDTIDNNKSGAFVLNSNFESVMFQCDGAHNWLVE